MSDPALTVMDIAKRFGVADPTLHIRWRKMGLATKPRAAAVKKEKVHGKHAKKVAAKEPPRTSREAPPSQPSEEVVRDIYNDWLRTGGDLLPIAMRYRIDQNILRKRFRALGLDDTGVRMPYEPPTVTAVPANSPGKHAEAAREMVAAGDAAALEQLRAESAALHQQLEDRDLANSQLGEALSAINAQLKQAHQEIEALQAAATAIEPIVGYGILHDLIDLLPVHGRWTEVDRVLWTNAFLSTLKLYVRS